MYADRYGAGPNLKPGSTLLALIGTVAPIAALVLGLQITNTILKPTRLIGVDIKEPPPPPPLEPVKVELQQPAPIERIYVPPLPIPIIVPDPQIDFAEDRPLGPVEPGPVGAGGTGTGVVEPVVIKPPVTVNAEIDPRYRSALQPPYPSEGIRAGLSGRVSLRVLIGADGRVKQVARVSATADYFYAAAEKQALGKWRFKPATKDGVAIEQWKVMNLSFVLNEG